MPEIKTTKNRASVTKFLASIEDEQKRKDARAVAKMMREATGSRGAMWGESVVGFGESSFHYADGRESAWFLAGFSPRKRDLTLYIMSGLDGQRALLKKLGPHRTGKACLYIKRLSDVDTDVLRELIERSVEAKRQR